MSERVKKFTCCLCKKRMKAKGNAFFCVPNDERRIKQWSEICRMEFPKHARICKDHFMASHIVKNTRREWLAPCAVPCLNMEFEDPIAITDVDIEQITPNEIVELEVEISGPIAEEPFEDVGTQTRDNRRILEAKVEKLEANKRNLQEDIVKLNRKIAKGDAALSTIKKIFTEGQMRNLLKPNHSRWSREDIANAIRLHSNGPKAYAYLLKRGYPLPPVSIMENWCRKVVIDEGFLSTSLGFFRHCTDLTNEDKVCVLALGELKLEGSDDPVGSSCVQVVMAQGLWKSWKRPIFFSFEQEIKKAVLLSIIEKVNKSSFPVVGVICDLKKKYLKLWKSLGVTTVHPWFDHPVNAQQRVYIFADAPRLLQQLRNQFIDPGILWNNELLTAHTISDIINHNLSKELELNNQHIAPNVEVKFELTAELFSKNTADVLRQCHFDGITLYKPNETAAFIELVSSWYNIMNSNMNSFSSSGKEPFGMLLTEQKTILMRINKWLAYNIIPNKVMLQDFQEAIIISNTSLVLLHDYTQQKYGMAYILTNRLNFDELRHLYDAIRSKGDAEDLLTPKEFKNRLRKYIYAQNIIHLHGTASAESDVIDSTGISETLESEKIVGKRKSGEEVDAPNESTPRKVFRDIDGCNKFVQQACKDIKHNNNKLPQQDISEEINENFQITSEIENKSIQSSQQNVNGSEEIANLRDATDEVILMNQQQQKLTSVSMVNSNGVVDLVSSSRLPNGTIIPIKQIPNKIIPIRKANTPVPQGAAVRLIGAKIIKLPKLTIEILAEPKKQNSVLHEIAKPKKQNSLLHEIVAERDPLILDEVDTANVHDVGTFVEDALKYISDYAYSEQNKQ